MKIILFLLCSLILPHLSQADVIHVVYREYFPKENGKEEPVWEQHGEDQKWTELNAGVHESQGTPKFPEITGNSKIEKNIQFNATKSGRGRIVISLSEGDKLLTSVTDHSFGDSCGLSYTYETGGGVFKIEILVWTHR